MRGIFRNICFEGFSLFLLAQMFSGVVIIGGLPTYLFGGLILWILSIILKPILNILTFPFALLTFGTISMLTNAIILFTLTKFVKQINIHAFTFNGLSFLGFVIPKMEFNIFVAFLVVSVGQIMIKWSLLWLTKG